MPYLPTLAQAADRDEIILSNSLLNSLANCEQAFHYRYVKGWQSQSSAAMSRGSWFHALAAADNLAKGMAAGTLLVTPETMNFGFDGLENVALSDDGSLTHQDREYMPGWKGALNLLWDTQWKPMPRELREQFNGSDTVYEGVDFPGQVADLYTRWLAHHADEAAGEEVLLVEAQWSRPVESGPAKGLFFGGRIDAVVRRADGFVVVRDYKTTGSPPSMTYRLTNLQTLLYAWGIDPLLPEGNGVSMVELDYVITKPPGLLRLKKATKAQLEADPEATGDPYANVGQMDALSFERQCEKLGENPADPKFEKIVAEIDGFEPLTHPFFQRWEMVANPSTVDRMLAEHGEAWPRAKALLMGEGLPTRSLHPVSCGMCRFKDECALEFQGANVEGYPATTTLPLVGGGKVACS